MGVGGLFSKVNAGLFNGVSQQAPVLRAPNQAEAQINGFSSLVHGLYKRPPVTTVKEVTFSSNALFHSIHRDQDEKYILVVSPSVENAVLSVFDLAGVQYPVVGSTTYFADSNPKDDLKVTTLADYTILANNKVTVETELVPEVQSATFSAVGTLSAPESVLSGSGSAVATIDSVTYTFSWASDDLPAKTGEDMIASIRAQIVATGQYSASVVDNDNTFTFQKLSGADFTLTVETPLSKTYNAATTVTAEYDRFGYIYVAKGIAEQTYTVKLNGISVASYTTGDTSHASTYKTTTIAEALYTQLVAAGWLCSLDGNVLRMSAVDGEDFTFDAYDTWGGEALRGFKGVNQSFKGLPPRCFDGAIVKIVGSTDTDEGEFWVKYEKTIVTGSSTLSTQGAWREHREPNRNHKLKASTMPHQLVRRQEAAYITGENPYGIYFDLEPIAWAERLVGDDYSAPAPSFAGGRIQDLVLFRNRLGIISGQSIALSRIGSFFNFFPTTVTDILDDDPMDVEASSNEASVIRYAVPVDKNLLLFGDEQQFILTSGESPFSLKTAQMFPALRYSFDVNTRPTTAAQTVFFADPIGDFTAIREYFIQADAVTYEAPNITSHVPKLLTRGAGAATVLCSVPSQNILGALTPSTNKLHIYKYEWQGNQKVQSAWSTWLLSKEYLTALAFNDSIYLVSEGSIDKLDLSFDPEAVLLDNGVTPYDFIYEFSPLLITSSESNVGDVDNNSLLRRLLLNISGDGDVTVRLKDYTTKATTLQYSRNPLRKLQSFFLRGKTFDYTVEITNSSAEQAVIESASFEIQVNKRSNPLG